MEDICGDLGGLIGFPLIEAEESTHSQPPKPHHKYDDISTWTFYKLRTLKGAVTIRWYGEGTACYSTKVDFIKVI